MRRFCVPLVLGVFSASVNGFAQDSSKAPAIGTGVQIPTLKSVKQLDFSAHKAKAKSDFVKNLTIESFGFSSAPTGRGFEFPSRLTGGPFPSSGFECPRCVIRPVTDRARYTLPPFGAEATWPLSRVASSYLQDSVA